MTAPTPGRGTAVAESEAAFPSGEFEFPCAVVVSGFGPVGAPAVERVSAAPPGARVESVAGWAALGRSADV
ncbi:hypothetical protein LTV02_26745 [Nocardia yamanashiensis]|uniref:hypothetical protein n=1 Tax=Nocardia yamanashiensis TaxID=209247 RepID=UPI001E415325|nr:hypothetical protein [Nocardia yamanashiensis]UGT39640.1 hypothetical protein LTV02_26745 [Nocardia yamanashiensis]